MYISDGGSNHFGKRKTVKRNEAPVWTTYPNILSGYRNNEVYSSYSVCVHSLFEFHTETGNVWTMILAIITSMTLYIYAEVSLRLNKNDRAIFVCFMLSCVLHAPLSIGYHLFMPISPDINLTWRRLDTGGVFVVSVLLTFALGRPVLPTPILFAVILSSTTTAALGVKEVLSWQSDKVIERKYLSRLISCAVLNYLFPTMYYVVRHLISNNSLDFSCIAVLGMIISLTSGCIIFDYGFPQNIYKGKSLITSHQIMHLSLVSAHLCEYAFIFSRVKLLS